MRQNLGNLPKASEEVAELGWESSTQKHQLKVCGYRESQWVSEQAAVPAMVPGQSGRRESPLTSEGSEQGFSPIRSSNYWREGGKKNGWVDTWAGGWEVL